MPASPVANQLDHGIVIFDPTALASSQSRSEPGTTTDTHPASRTLPPEAPEGLVGFQGRPYPFAAAVRRAAQ